MRRLCMVYMAAYTYMSFAGQVIIVNKNNWLLRVNIFDNKKESAHIDLKKDEIGCIQSSSTINWFVLQNPDGNQFPYNTNIKPGHQVCIEAYWNEGRQTYDLKPLATCPVICRLTQSQKEK